MRVLIVGHACAPDSGSEPGLTWNWARYLSQRHDVVVLSHPQHREKVEAELAEEPSARLRFEWVSLPRRFDPWRPERGERNIKLHYLLWQHGALRRAKALHAASPFDIVHHVSWGTIGISTPLWRLGIPLIWGPLGGGQVFPLRFLGYAGSAWPKELARYLRLELLPLVPTFRRAVRRAAAVLVTNRESGLRLEQAAGYRPAIFADNGLLESEVATEPPSRPLAGPLEALWVGRVEPRKGLLLALEGVAAASAEIEVRLTVAGSGPDLERAKRHAARLGLEERVRFLGQVPRPEVMRLLRESHCLLFTSLRDSFGSVVLEAMGKGLPVIILDHQGVAACIPVGAAFRVAVEHPRQCVTDLGAALREVARSSDLRRRLGEAALAAARQQLWPERARAMEAIYLSAVRRWKIDLLPAPAESGRDVAVPVQKAAEGSRD